MLDVVKVDDDEVVAVCSTLLVKEAERMEQLVHHHARASTIGTNRNVHLLVDVVTHWGWTSENIF